MEMTIGIIIIVIRIEVRNYLEPLLKRKDIIWQLHFRMKNIIQS